mgnify:CR=1 FL=1
MSESLKTLIELIRKYDGINDKARLARLVAETFGLTKDRSVYYCLLSLISTVDPSASRC